MKSQVAGLSELYFTLLSFFSKQETRKWAFWIARFGEGSSIQVQFSSKYLKCIVLNGKVHTKCFRCSRDNMCTADTQPALGQQKHSAKCNGLLVKYQLLRLKNAWIFCFVFGVFLNCMHLNYFKLLYFRCKSTVCTLNHFEGKGIYRQPTLYPQAPQR